MQTIAKHAAFLVSATFFIILLVLLTVRTVAANSGCLVYTVDDPYIHMAMAKNFAEHGVWGVTRFAFSSSTSSPLWTLLLVVVYRIFGVSEWAPGILATGFALAALYVMDAFLRRRGVRMILRVVAGLGMAYAVPLVPLVSTGMEHAMHLFFMLCFIVALLEFLSEYRGGPHALMCITGVLAVATRYESLFLIAPVALYFMLLRRWRSAGWLLLSAAIPVLSYGAFSLRHGSAFLPNTLIVKSTLSEAHTALDFIKALASRWLRNAVNVPHLQALSTALLLGCGLHFWRRRYDHIAGVAFCLLLAILLHLIFASVGWYYRYEAYLIGVAMPVVLVLLWTTPFAWQTCWAGCRGRWLGGLVLLAAAYLAWPLHARAAKSLQQFVRASHHIYRQQYQMGKFLRETCPPEISVACNDLGCVAFFSDAKILDLWGLGDFEVAQAKRAGKYDATCLTQLLEKHQVEIVMVYSNWFEKNWPAGLIPVASWVVISNFYGKKVDFYARSENGAAELAAWLRKYQTNLPPSVLVGFSQRHVP